MINLEKITFHKNPNFVLALILFVFLLKGVFLSTAFPVFDGQDEARHYNTIQFLNQPKDFVANNKRPLVKNKDLFTDYNFSEEIVNTGTAAGVDDLRSGIYNTTSYANSYDGKNEGEISTNNWKPYDDYAAPDIVYSTQFYHQLSSLIEKTFASQSILIRFYLIRIFSVLLGALFVLLSFLIAKTIGFSSRHALLVAAIISFQPKFSMYFAGINYDVLLIPMFALFIYAGVLALKNGLNWKNILLFVLSIFIATQTKGTGFILGLPLVFLLTYFAWEKIRKLEKKIQIIVYAASAVCIVLAAGFLISHLPGHVGNMPLSKVVSSVSKYLSKSLTIGRFALSSRTYWGTLGWTNSWVINNITDFIWFVQAFAVAGLGMLFFSKKKYPEFLPEKKYLVFLVGMILALQFGIRTADWAIFNQSGSLDLGTPGRYFLPSLIAHIILVFVGLGAFFSYFFGETKLGIVLDSLPTGRQAVLRGNDKSDDAHDKVKSENDSAEKFFDYSLLIGLILMFAFSMYLIFDVILYRFYL